MDSDILIYALKWLEYDRIQQYTPFCVVFTNFTAILGSKLPKIGEKSPKKRENFIKIANYRYVITLYDI